MPDFLRNPLVSIYLEIERLLRGTGMSDELLNVLMQLLGVIVVATFGLLLIIFTTWLERKIVARMQDRLGPNRAGPFGLLQSFADVIKFLTKEDLMPAGADRWVFNIAPLMAVVAVLLIWAVVPFSWNMIGTNVNIGVIYIVAIGAFGTLSILMAGWGSNNKYALLGAFRVVAQLISYEVPMILALLVPVLLARSMRMNDVVTAQGVWFVVLAPIAALLFFITSLAEIGRTPFDLLEAESEIVAGYHIEYSGMKWALFMLAEFLHAFTVSALFTVLFLGGWRGPGVGDLSNPGIPILGVVYFLIKSFLVYFVIMWVRATFPRIRIDHMLAFCWKVLTPVSLVNIMVIAIVDKVLDEYFPALAADWPRAGVLLVTNLIMGVVILAVIAAAARRARQKETSPLVRPEPAMTPGAAR
jgi:NADH-quinone oxidoreductase subunit H